MSPEQLYGQKWEIKLVEELSRFGLPVIRRSESDWTDTIDIELGNMLIHCKAAKSKRHKAHDKVWRSRYQFNFSMVTSGDFIVAICDTWGDPVFFVIPVKELTKKGMYITSHPLVYKGWAAKYRNCWNLLQEINHVQS